MQMLTSVLFSLGVAVCLLSLITKSISQSLGDVRLVNSSIESEGRVEVFYNGSWGTICDSYWDINDAKVVCRQLGYPGAKFAYSHAYFGRGTGKIWLVSLYCSGTEQNISSCSHGPWSGYSWMRSNCGHNRDAGVACHNKTAPDLNRGGSCTFETGADLCGYTNAGASLDWTLTASNYHHYYYYYVSLPYTDHTYGNGHYVVVKMHYNRGTHMARLVSPQITGGKCLRFYHHMRGPRFAQLNVYVESDAKNRTLLWQQVGGQYLYSTWMMVMIPIAGFTTFKIIFEGGILEGFAYAGDIALDDIEIRNETCILENSGNCTFDRGNLCGYINAKDDDFDWSLHSGKTQNYYATGPYKDHTTGKGNYIYIRTSSRSAGEIARLVSPEIYDCSCVEFYYHMKGSTIGELNVFIDDGVAKKMVWQLIGEQSSNWSKGMIPVKRLKAFKLIFEGVSGSDYRGNIAIDDIIVHRETCVLFPSSASVVPINISSIIHNVRLADGNVSSAGRIEVFHKGRWGTVCGLNFPITSARVVCKELGFLDALMLIPCCSVFPAGKGRIMLDDVRCRGDEPSITQCSHKGWGVSRCSHSQDVGVVCRTENHLINVRLNASSMDFEGRVEIQIGGVWGTVSDRGWDIYDANVVCRQIGFAGATGSFNGAHYGRGSGPVWISNAACDGNETEIQKCNLTLNRNLYTYYWSSTWAHRRDAGVECFDLRLTGGRNESQGIIEIRYLGTWGTICNDGWDMNDAKVVCRQLGYDRAVSLTLGYSAIPTPRINPVMTGLKCRGTEPSIGLCGYQTLLSVTHQCTHLTDAQVICAKPIHVPSTDAPEIKASVEIRFVKLRQEEWLAPVFQKSMAEQLNEYCRNRPCGDQNKKFHASDIVILKNYPRMSQGHLLVRFKVYYPGSNKIFPKQTIYDIAKEQKNIAGYSVVLPSDVFPSPQAKTGESAGLSKKMKIVVITSLVALAIGAVFIIVFIYRKRKRMRASSVRYRALNINPDVDDDVYEDSLLSLHHDDDQSPLIS